YLQRSGRAGRSNESRAISYTLCKGNPHDQQVFSDPLWPFKTVIPAPAVALNSSRLVQRHINSFLLAEFLCNAAGKISKDRTKLNTFWFFNVDSGESIAAKFSGWLLKAATSVDDSLAQLVKGTVLQGTQPEKLRNF